MQWHNNDTDKGIARNEQAAQIDFKMDQKLAW